MKRKGFFVVFFLVLTADLVVIGAELSTYLRYFTKPAITISLLVYLFKVQHVSKFPNNYLVLVLFFSMIGDILLLFPEEIQRFFIGGLLAFLSAHIMYIAAFFDLKNLRSKRVF